MDDFDERVELQKKKNFEYLKSLNLDEPLLPPSKKRGNPRAPKKRKAASIEADSDDGGDDSPAPTKIARSSSGDGAEDGAGLRRSGRNRGKAVNYNDDSSMNSSARLPKLTVQMSGLGAGTEPKSATMRVHDPKVFGAIPGISVGTWWKTREDCSLDAVHAPWVAGISSGSEGAYSVALSGGYEDDVDLGNAFTYTGSGGRDLKGTKTQPKNLRTAPQSCDQSFENPFNRALQKSCETRNPIRVIRGYKLHSPYAPLEGYRYDGLYTVEKAWMETGLNKKGFMVCKFAFKRVPGQAPLQYGDEEDKNRSCSERDVSEQVEEDRKASD